MDRHDDFMNGDLHGDPGSTQRRLDAASLAAMKKQRKQVESDAQILANRIALLKQEELKSWKKIEETKKKAKEVYSLKKKNEDKMKEKQEKQMNHMENLRGSQVQSNDLRKQKEMDRKNIRDAIQGYKHEEMIQIKNQRDKNEKKKREFQLKVLYDNQQKSRNIKEQETLGSLRKKEYEETKMLKFKMEHDRRVHEEEQMKMRKEMEVLNMEKLEMELIRKLQHTQLLQKQAYEELETVLTAQPEDYAKKFMTSSQNLEPLDSKGFKTNKSSENKSASQSPNGLKGQPNKANEEFYVTERKADPMTSSQPNMNKVPSGANTQTNLNQSDSPSKTAPKGGK